MKTLNISLFGTLVQSRLKLKKPDLCVVKCNFIEKMNGFETVFFFLCNQLLESLDDDNKMAIFEYLVSAADIKLREQCITLCRSLGCSRLQQLVINQTNRNWLKKDKKRK